VLLRAAHGAAGDAAGSLVAEFANTPPSGTGPQDAATRLAEGTTVELRLLVRAGGRPETAVEVQAPSDASMAAVGEALAYAIGVEVGELVLDRTGEPLDGHGELAHAGLREGDRLKIVQANELGEGRPHTATETPLELVVTGGPLSGRRLPLAYGDHELGRDPSCAIVLEDAALSARHLQLSVYEDGSATVTDVGSRNGSQLEGDALAPDEPRPLPPGWLVAAGRTLLEVRAPQPEPPPPAAGPDGTIGFNRPPRVQRPLEPAVRPFPAPPEPPQRGRLPLGAALIPLALGLGLYLFTRIPTMLFFATLSPVMAVTTYVEDRRGGRKGFERKSREYRERLATLKDELEAERADETEQRRASAPDAATLIARVRTVEPSLWERRPGDPDFLALRVGSADRPSQLSVRIDAGGAPELRAEVEEVAAFYAVAPAVPVAVPLGELGSVGLCGPDAGVDGLGRWLVAQAAALHSPQELQIAAAVGDVRAETWSWIRWLPHARETRSFARGPVAARALVERAARIVDERAEAAETAFAARRRGPALLLVLDETVAPERPLVERLFAGAAEAGVAVVWLGRERRDLPGSCGGIAELEHTSARLTLTDTRSGSTTVGVSADGLAPALAEELALALAPVRDTSSSAAAGGVPDSVSFLGLLGADEPLTAWIDARWGAAHGVDPGAGAGTGLDAPIGLSASEPFSVDLRADGPHALVAGMTGAGKSELLQSLIASLAVRHPPGRLTFLLIDYKGGAAFKECAELPHTVGLVTDLDEHLTQRALVSLNAELQRRERILRGASAKDLADMERRDPEDAPPSLAIVIDEFATLAKEVPDFIDGIVDVAQRGRSLGVHLVLATQRPGGIVSENIRANTNLRIALRVSDPAESTDVIGVQDAARIGRDRPGRAYARTGHGELTEIQVAYAGGSTPQGTDRRAIRVRRLDDAGLLDLPAARLGGDSDLRLVVEAAAAAARARGLERPSSPWLPPLPALLLLETLPEPERPDAVALVGLLDEPERQTQRPLALDFEAEGSVLVYGTSGSGKTALLRTLAIALASRSSPQELHLYGLDFATRGLGVLEQLPHCGAVIAGEDEERTARLFAHLRRTLERRKSLFSHQGVFSLAEWRAARPEEPLPRILVLLDNYAGFAAAFERVNLGELVDALPRLVGEGRPLGVHFAVTADRRGAMPNALAGIVPSKLVLRMADEDEYAALGIPLRTIRGAQLPPGRGFLPGGVEFQIALPGGDASGSGQAAAVAAAAQQLATRYRTHGAPAIEPLPTQVARSTLPQPSVPLAAVIGLGDADLQPVEISLAERHFLVVGPYRGGRSTALGTIVSSLRARADRDLHLLAPRRSPLVGLPFWTSIAEGEEACARLATELSIELGPRPPFVLVIDDGDELAESAAALALETIVRRGRDLEVRVVAVAERQAVQRAFGGWLRELRKEEHGLLLDPDVNVDGEILGTRLPRRTNPVFPPGRGYLVRRGAVELVQLAC
jgi:DNA segregation ATPase FtsK/SpoIIIE, S-DNA-T family